MFEYSRRWKLVFWGVGALAVVLGLVTLSDLQVGLQNTRGAALLRAEWQERALCFPEEPTRSQTLNPKPKTLNLVARILATKTSEYPGKIVRSLCRRIRKLENLNLSAHGSFRT